MSRNPLLEKLLFCLIFLELISPLGLQRKKKALEKKGSDAEFEQKRMTLGITVDTKELELNKENLSGRKDVRDLRNKLNRKERSLSQDDQVRRGREGDSRLRSVKEQSPYRGTKVKCRATVFIVTLSKWMKYF